MIFETGGSSRFGSVMADHVRFSSAHLIKDESVVNGNGYHDDYSRGNPMGYPNCYYGPPGIAPMEIEDPWKPIGAVTTSISPHQSMYPSSDAPYHHHPSPQYPGYTREMTCQSPDCGPRFGGDLDHKNHLFPVPEKRKCGSNKKERRRTQSINNAFANLRDCIPNVPCDTKLSKIKTLRLATSYIDYLMTLLNTNDPAMFIEGFKADIHKKWNEKSEEQKRKELEAELTNSGTAHRIRSKRSGARTGWPQHVWALELH
ncbi:hypothetical protein TCAL_00943 [Tigriopus californicus]|uniref:BHLH domain-containing protein n=1 Tax=Tigriopus californicus TaxID=6832 RepID=A0A553P688_TIGCA|nr:heart- and neural crest derivatives-expressed protein 2-like [Tigriopus californicus]TRY73191.1 hypothetical protein TCAL_00943 [Tigriopus californicus]